MDKEINTVSEEQVLHNKLSFEINQELIHLMKRIVELQQENERLKDKFKDLEEWLEAMASMYEDEYKDVDASEHYKCMLHKLKEN